MAEVCQKCGGNGEISEKTETQTGYGVTVVDHEVKACPDCR